MRSLVLIVDGVPKNGNAKDAQKMLAKWGVAAEDVAKVKKIHRKSNMQVTAVSEEALERLLRLEGADNGKGKKLRVSRKEARRDLGEQGDETANKRAKPDQPEDAAAVAVVHDVRDVVTPLWKQPYAEQIAWKNKEFELLLKKMRRKTEREGKEKTAAWPMPTIIRPMLAAENGGVEGVARNKLSFTIGNDQQGKICIGFRVGRTEHGSTAVADPNAVLFCAPAALAVRNALQLILESTPELVAKNNISHLGFWRQLECRTNLKGQVLAVVQADETGVDPNLLGTVKQRVRDQLLAAVPSLVGLGWQHSGSFSNSGETNAGPIQYLHGDGFLTEHLRDVIYRIPPAAFFQTNSVRVVELYDMVCDAVDQEAKRLGGDHGPIRVFDVCCGIGTIGLYIRKKLGTDRIGSIVGIDIEPSGIEAANQNAQLNNLTNISFIASPAEKVLPGKLKEANLQQGPIIAVVDPPRAGLHTDVTRALRNCPLVKSVVYVSCNPKSLVMDTLPLCKPVTKRFENEPFVPVYLSGVDMFPHTELIESVVIFQRQ